jgi:motility quorum-sensing regulator/GCU-specific mRNA interferase toxin
MEKLTPHTKLPLIKSLIKSGHVSFTNSAVMGADKLGFDRDDMIETALSLTARDFHKSMTTYADSKVWQDVYRPMTKAGRVYMKFTVSDGVLIVSFKEL